VPFACRWTGRRHVGGALPPTWALPARRRADGFPIGEPRPPGGGERSDNKREND